MPEPDLNGTTALVTGSSRGFGRATALALAAAGAQVIAVGRDRDRLAALQRQLGDTGSVVAADVTDPVVAGELVDRYRPTALVLNAGAAPLSRPLHHHTWETFSRNWDVDVRHVFHWTREALLQPLAQGSTVVALSSGAALRGSPLSGGYAGAKATIRFLTGYAAQEARRAGLGIRFISVLPQLTAATELGAAAVAAYAARDGADADDYARTHGFALTPAQVGSSIVGLIGGEGDGAYALAPSGLTAL